ATTSCARERTRLMEEEAREEQKRHSLPPARTKADSLAEAAPSTPAAATKSPYRHLISSSSAKQLEPASPKSPAERSPKQPSAASPVASSDRAPASPSDKANTPKNRKELHEDLGRELAQLAEDLRNVFTSAGCFAGKHAGCKREFGV
ncbi:unnamed protein product, partial [Effrenium voratum]